MKTKLQIKSILGNVLFEYECENNTIKKTVEKAVKEKANLRSANLSSADLSYADLSSANLRYANLRYADLSYANLRYADLSSADLRYADLRYADLSYAKNIKQYYRNDLNILKIQTGKLYAYKYLNGEVSPYQNTKYEIGKEYELKKEDCDYDEKNDCGKGLNVASLEWCLRDTNEDLTKTYVLVEFDVKDLVAIPYFTDGKFRVRKFKIIRKLTEKELKKACKSIK